MNTTSLHPLPTGLGCHGRGARARDLAEGALLAIVGVPAVALAAAWLVTLGWNLLAGETSLGTLVTLGLVLLVLLAAGAWATCAGVCLCDRAFRRRGPRPP
ncbi:MAG: hypothetical protein ACOZNI_13305 [Myxococcota bacterium]